MRHLRRNTATVVPVGPFIDDTDGKTLEEALTVASIDVQLIQPLDTATIPPDRVANGAFASDTAWTKNSWTIAAGVADSAGAQSTILSQTPAIGFNQNVAYEVVYDVVTQSAGSVTVSIGGTDGAARSTVATFTETIIAGSGALIEFKASGFTGTIDNVVIKQVPIPIIPAASGSSNDMVLARANTGTYDLELTAAQVFITGPHRLTAFISGALVAWDDYDVLEEPIYDALIAASAAGFDSNQRVNIGQWLSQAVTLSIGNKPDVNVNEVSDDAGAAINLEAQFDGTGYVDDTAPSTQSQLSGIANVGAAVNRPADSYTLTTGTQSSGTVSSTEALDSTNHEHTDTAGAMDLLYDFLIGGGIAESVTFTGALFNNNDDLEVQAWDWVASAWVQIGTLVGKNSTVNEVNVYNLFVDMTGSGSDQGKVRIRFTDGAFTLTSSTLRIDQLFISFSQDTQGYALGAIWINTSLSNTNTVPRVDGTATNPVSTIAAALTLSTSTNLDKFQVSPGSTITFAAAINAKTFEGESWTLALGGQDIANSTFIGAAVTGIGTGSGVQNFKDCRMGAVTLPPDTHVTHGSGIEGTQTAGAEGEYFYDDVHSDIAGSDSWTFDFGAALNASNLSVRHASGGTEIQNMGAGTGTYNFTIEGHGQVIFNANCSATSIIEIRGHFKKTNNASGLTINDDPRFDVAQIKAQADTALSDYDSPTKAEMDTAHALLATAAVNTEARLAELDPANLPTDIAAIPTTAMRGTDNAALASVAREARLAELDAAYIPADIDTILGDTADMQPLIERMAYVGPYGPGVYIDDGAANTNTVFGTDGTEDNPVSTIAAATTIVTVLGSQRFYLKNDTQIILAQAYKGYEFIGIGEMTANTINLGSQDVDNSNFENVLISGTQGGTGRFQAKNCVLSVIVSMEVTASACVMAAGTLTLRDDCMFDSCFSAVSGAGTPILDINSVANVNVYFRHHSGGLQINNAVATTVMSYEADGQLIIDATCTSLTIIPRGNCSFTDNGTTTNFDLDAAVTRTGINAEVDNAFTTQMADSVPADGTIPTREQMLYMIGQFLMEFSASGTTVTIKKVDGATTLMTFTLDDGTTPTSITRAT